MNRNFGFQLKSVILCLALAGATAFAEDAAVDAKAISKTLSSVPAPELAPTAARLVSQASDKQLEQTVREVVVASVKLNPTAPIAVVSAVANQKQDMAPVAAGTAAVLAPKLAVGIAKAAATAAPTQAAKIVQAVCEAAPKQYRQIALSVAQIVPGQSKAILDAVAMAVPQLKDRIEKGLAANPEITPTMLAAILQGIEHPTIAAATTPSSAPQKLDAPTLGDPFKTPTSSPHIINPGDNSSGSDPGRDYSAP